MAGKIELTAPAKSQQQEAPTVQSNATAQEAKLEAKEAPKHEESAGPTDASRQQAEALAAKLEASRAARYEQEQSQTAQQSS